MSSNLITYNSDKTQENKASIFRFKSDRLIFFICILIAIVFWLLIKLSDVYTVENSFKLTYSNDPAGFRVTELVDSTLDLNLTARGFAILKMNLFNDMENLDINLDNYTLEPRGDEVYAIYTQELTNKLAEVVGVAENNIQFSKTMLIFEMERTSEKRIQVIPEYSLSFVSQYDLYNTVISDPAFIMVYGPLSILDTLESISTIKLLQENIMSDQTVKIDLENPNVDLLRLEVKEVMLSFEVEKFTESEILVPVNLSNLEYKIKTFPSQVKVFYRVAQIDFNEVRSNQFNVFPVINNKNLNQVNKLSLKLLKQPDFVRNVRVVPSEVEFLIIK